MSNSLNTLQQLSDELTDLGYVSMVEDKTERFPVPQLFCHLAERVVTKENEEGAETAKTAGGEEEQDTETILAQMFFSSDIAKNLSLQVSEAEERLTINIMLPSVEVAEDPKDLALFAHFLNEGATVGVYHYSDPDHTLYYRIVLPASAVKAQLLEQLFDDAIEAINLHLPLLETLAAGAISYEQAVKTILTITTASLLEAAGGVQ